MLQTIDDFIDAAIKGRYLTLFACIAVFIAGVIAWKLLPIEAYPELANPQVRVISLVPGKGPEEIEKLNQQFGSFVKSLNPAPFYIL